VHAKRKAQDCAVLDSTEQGSAKHNKSEQDNAGQCRIMVSFEGKCRTL